MIANLAATALLAAAFAMSHRLFGVGADEMAHFDYAYQIWHGRLPVFEDGLAVNPPWGAHPPTQWTAQHPPLFYLLAAPFIGPLVDEGRYVAAGYAGRAVSAAVATGVTAAIMWLGREVAPRRPALWLSAGLVAGVSPPVVIFGGAFYNDNLLVAFSTLLIAVTVRMLRRGPSRWTLGLFGLFTAGALWSRASAIVPIGLCGLVLGLSWLLRRPPAWKWLAGLAISSFVATLTITWFYLRNLRLAGNLFGARLGEDLTYLQNRVARPFHEVLVDPAVWLGWHLAWGYGAVDPFWSAVLLIGVPLLVAAVLTTRRLRRSHKPYEIWTVLLLAGLLVGIVVVQAEYTANRGGTSWRYLKPQLPAIALAVAWAVTAVKRLAPLLLPTWLAAAVIPLAMNCVDSLIEPNRLSTAPSFPNATSAFLTLGVAAVAVAALAILLLPPPECTSTPDVGRRTSAAGK